MQALGGTVGIDAFASDSSGVAVRGDISDGGPSAIAGHFVGGGANHAVAILLKGPRSSPHCGNSRVILATRPSSFVRGLTIRRSEILLTNASTDAVKVAWLI